MPCSSRLTRLAMTMMAPTTGFAAVAAAPGAQRRAARLAAAAAGLVLHPAAGAPLHNVLHFAPRAGFSFGGAVIPSTIRNAMASATTPAQATPPMAHRRTVDGSYPPIITL